MKGDVRLPLEWNMPLSGAVTMPINMPFANGFNINLGKSLDPGLETKLIAQVGSYGRQLGRICEVVSVMLAHLEAGTKPAEDDPAVKAFRTMARLIEATKQDHKK